MQLLGYFASLLIGLSLGLIGGGGSILTVPVLVYLFGLSPAIATSYSLFIVGITSGVGGAKSIIDHRAEVRTALLFGLTSTVTVFIIRHFLIPGIPAQLTMIHGIAITYSLLTMLVFALLMLIAGWRMISNRIAAEHKEPDERRIYRLLFIGVGVGIITGFLGIGGGFIIVPALVLLLKMPMKDAVGTSLLIITMNALTGFASDKGHVAYNWHLLLLVSAIAVSGLFIGSALNSRLSSGTLKKAFGCLVIGIGGFIIIKELIANHIF